MWMCLECHRKFKTTGAAQKASNNGCPQCGGVDIDLAPVTSSVPEQHRRKIAKQNANMPAALRNVLNG